MRDIVFTKDTCSGEPRIDGTRLTCANVAFLMYFQSHSIETIIKTYPYLQHEDIMNCLRYCSKKKCVVDKVTNYCQGCSLDSRGEDAPVKYIRNLKGAEPNTSGYSFFGSVKEYLDSEEKLDVWKVSQSVLDYINK